MTHFDRYARAGLFALAAAAAACSSSDAEPNPSYPELPAEPDLSQMVETVNGQGASAFNGHVYVWGPESGTYTRYAVDDAYHLAPNGVVRFMHLGGTGNSTSGDLWAIGRVR